MKYHVNDFVKKKDFETKPDWIIHVVSAGSCNSCRRKDLSPVSSAICDAHTHGLEKYKSKNIQMALRLPDREIGRILNVISFMIRNGARFQSGDLIDGIYEDCSIRLEEFLDSEGELVLRVIIPDAEGKWPEDPACTAPYNLQLLTITTIYTDAKPS